MKYVGENALKKWTSLVKSDIKKKLDKNQGTANSGKILGVDASGEVAPTDTEVATLVDVPNGIVKGDGSTLSAAVAGTDYMAPPTGGTAGQILKKTETGTEWADVPQTVTILETTALLKGDGSGGVSAAVAGTDYMAPPTGGTTGQVLTKTADGQEWQDREKDLFVVTISGDDSSGYTADKTFSEIKAAYDEGRTVVAITVVGSMTCPLFLVYVAAGLVQFTAALFDNVPATLSITMDKNNNIARDLTYNQAVINASGLLKGDGIGGISAATAGTDYMAPPTGGTAGQVLTKTTDGQEWQDREKDLFIVTISVVSNTTYTADKTFLEIKEAYDAGKVCFASITSGGVGILLPIVQLIKDTALIFGALTSSDINSMLMIHADNSIEVGSKQFQKYITATGLLKGNGDGGVSAAVAGTDYVTPSDMTSAIQSAIQNTWEASY